MEKETFKKACKKPVVYIVDDERMVLKAISQSVSSLECSVYSFESAKACLLAQTEKKSDLIISDINMPETDGIELLKRIKSEWSETKVLLLTGYGDIPLAVEAVKNGALDFVEKPLDENTFLPKIRVILESIQKSNNSNISDAELGILKLVAAGKSNKEIAYLIGRSIRTVENHRHRLMKKLKIASQADLVKFAIGRGLVSVTEK